MSTDQWIPAPPQPPGPPPPGLPPANSWSTVTPCAAADSPSIADGVIITGRPAVVSAMPWQITLNDGLNPPDFTIDHYDASGVLIEHPIAIDGTSGDVTLTHNPTQPLGVVTKQYVDAIALTDAPSDGNTYARRNAVWNQVVPATGGTFTGGTAFTSGIILASPTNINMGGGTVGQVLTKTGVVSLAWGDPGLSDAPSDGQFYTRQNAGWAVSPGGMTDAPNDGTAYARKSAAWAHLTHLDITDWAATLANYYPTSNPSGYQTAAQVTAALAPYALTASVPVASTTPPLMDGTAAVGTGATWARADHVHPVDTSRYAASNPSGYQTAAQVTAVLPVASSTTPLMNGTAAVGTSAAFARGDHVHPTDTTRAAQASLASYLPLAGGTLTGLLSGTTINASATISATGAIAGSTVTASQGLMQVQKGSATNPSFYLNDGSSNRSGFIFSVAATQTMLVDLAASLYLILDPAVGFTYSGGGNAYKAGGGAWGTTSDARIKTVQSEYEHGLDEVLALRPVVYTYKGNDTPTADGPSPHAGVADDATEFVGLVAQEVEPIFTGMVTRRAGFIDGEPVDDLRSLNTTELIFALVNAVKTLTARVAELEAARG